MTSITFTYDNAEYSINRMAVVPIPAALLRRARNG
jgi:hypothetical protein